MNDDFLKSAKIEMKTLSSNILSRNFSIVFLLLLTLGCGSGRVKVTGSVTFDDGTPLTVGIVVFSGPSTEASGELDAKGRYTLGEFKPGDGVMPGKYKVFIANAAIVEVVDEGRDRVAVPSIPLIDAKFEAAGTSGLSCEVVKKTTFDIVVTKPVGKSSGKQ